jgi:release factor glutamine methyltransferase
MDHFKHIFFKMIVKPVLRVYLRRDTQMRYDGFRLRINRNVFHPSFFFSTKYFYSFLDTLDLKGKKVLEIGCGSGLLSMLAYRKGAIVTAVDIDVNAVDNTRANFKKNFSREENRMILRSDLFSAVPSGQFHIILLNPPFYFRRPVNQGEHAWYAGENGEYFQRFFAELHMYIQPQTTVYMLLPESPLLARIRHMAETAGFTLAVAASKKIQWETNYIFGISHRNMQQVFGEAVKEKTGTP